MESWQPEPGTEVVFHRRDGSVRPDSPHLHAVAPAPVEAYGRPVDDEPDVLAARPVIPAPRTRNPNRAGALRNNARAIWWQLTRTGSQCALGGLLMWIGVHLWTGSSFWAWVAAAGPIVIFLVWMRLVIAQARAHYRGDAMPPPGAYPGW